MFKVENACMLRQPLGWGYIPNPSPNSNQQDTRLFFLAWTRHNCGARPRRRVGILRGAGSFSLSPARVVTFCSRSIWRFHLHHVIPIYPMIRIRRTNLIVFFFSCTTYSVCRRVYTSLCECMRALSARKVWYNNIMNILTSAHHSRIFPHHTSRLTTRSWRLNIWIYHTSRTSYEVYIYEVCE